MRNKTLSLQRYQLHLFPQTSIPPKSSNGDPFLLNDANHDLEMVPKRSRREKIEKKKRVSKRSRTSKSSLCKQISIKPGKPNHNPLNLNVQQGGQGLMSLEKGRGEGARWRYAWFSSRIMSFRPPPCLLQSQKRGIKLR